MSFGASICSHCHLEIGRSRIRQEYRRRRSPLVLPFAHLHWGGGEGGGGLGLVWLGSGVRSEWMGLQFFSGGGFHSNLCNLSVFCIVILFDHYYYYSFLIIIIIFFSIQENQFDHITLYLVM